MSRGTLIAAEIRTKCNSLTTKERKELLNRGVRIIQAAMRYDAEKNQKRIAREIKKRVSEMIRDIYAAFVYELPPQLEGKTKEEIAVLIDKKLTQLQRHWLFY